MLIRTVFQLVWGSLRLAPNIPAAGNNVPVLERSRCSQYFTTSGVLTMEGVMDFIQSHSTSIPHHTLIMLTN